MKHITVLIIDEHPEVNARLAHGLSAMAGFRVVAHTTNPVWAAEFAHHWNPQIIIADFKRGHRPRSEMVRWMKENSPDSQIVVFSAYYLEDERNEFLQAGAARCLLKGLTLNELAAELRNVAQEAPAIDAESVYGSKGTQR
jgi:two-component system nitrate/nitrite response regulator NarL